MLYRTMKRLIVLSQERGSVAGLQDKLDVFFAADRLTKEEYDELSAMLNGTVK